MKMIFSVTLFTVPEKYAFIFYYAALDTVVAEAWLEKAIRKPIAFYEMV